MKTNWAVVVVLVGAIVVAGLFVHGMTRVSGLAPTRAQATAGAPAITVVRAAESVPGVGAGPASHGDARQATLTPATVADVAPAGATAPTQRSDEAARSEAATSSGEATAPNAVPVHAAAAAAASDRPPGPSSTLTAGSAAPSRRPTPRADDKRTQEAPSTPLSAAQRRRAQCRTLAAWLQQLDAIAGERRGDAGYQEWTRAQRDQARERQAELACTRTPA